MLFSLWRTTRPGNTRHNVDTPMKWPTGCLSLRRLTTHAVAEETDALSHYLQVNVTTTKLITKNSIYAVQVAIIEIVCGLHLEILQILFVCSKYNILTNLTLYWTSKFKVLFKLPREYNHPYSSCLSLHVSVHHLSFPCTILPHCGLWRSHGAPATPLLQSKTAAAYP